MEKAERVILGIDPGTNVMGYGVIGITNNKAHMISMGVIDMRKMADPYLRLGKIFERVTGIIESFLPDELALKLRFSEKMCNRCSNSDAHRAWPSRPPYVATFPFTNMLR